MPTKPAAKLAAKPIPTVTIGEKTVPFDLNFNDWCVYETETGRTVGEVVVELAKNPSMKVLRRLTELALSDADNVYSADEAGQVVSQVGLLKVVELVTESVGRVMGGAFGLPKAA